MEASAETGETASAETGSVAAEAGSSAAASWGIPPVWQEAPADLDAAGPGSAAVRAAAPAAEEETVQPEAAAPARAPADRSEMEQMHSRLEVLERGMEDIKVMLAQIQDRLSAM